MIKYKYFFLILLVALISCQKQKQLENALSDTAVLDQLKFATNLDTLNSSQAKTIQPLVIVSWDWGRGGSCYHKFGFCNVTWFPNKKSSRVAKNNYSYSSTLKFDDKLDKYYILILLAEYPNNIPVSSLTIRQKIPYALQLDNGQVLELLDKDYNFDKNLGKFGGWKIYFE